MSTVRSRYSVTTCKSVLLPVHFSGFLKKTLLLYDVGGGEWVAGEEGVGGK